MRLRESEFQAVVSAAAHLRGHPLPNDANLARLLSRAYDYRVPLRHVVTICRMARCAVARSECSTRPPIPSWLRSRVLRGQARCALCSKPFSAKSRAEIAHLIPVRLGGVTEPQNLAALCFDCNRHQGGGLLAVEAYAKIWRI